MHSDPPNHDDPSLKDRQEGQYSAAPNADELLHLINENVKDYAIFSTDSRGYIMSWNVGAERILGYAADQALGMDSRAIFTPEDRRQGAADSEMSAAAQEGRATDERWHVRNDGSRFWGSGFLTALRDHQGQLRGYVKILRDLTERRENSQARRKSEERYQVISEMISDFAYSYLVQPDLSLELEWITESVQNALGYTVEEINQIGWQALVHPDDQPLVWKQLDRLLSHETDTSEYRLFNKSGDVLWLRNYLKPVWDDKQKRVIRLYGAAQNITLRKRVETERDELLRQSIQKSAELSAVIECIPDGVYIGTRQGIAVCNKIGLGMLGADSVAELHESIGALADKIRTRDANTGKAMEESDQPFLHALLGETSVREVTITNMRTGRDITVRSAAAPVIHNGQVIGAVAINTDITDLKRQHSEIVDLNQQLQRAMVETHHRVKNNLQVIAAMVELETHRHEDTVPIAEFHRLITHVRSLAAVHHVLTGEARADGEARFVSASEMLEKLLPLLQQTAGPGRLNVPRLDDAKITARQATGIAIIVNELVLNAIKHGKGAVDVEFASEMDTASLIVCDDGPGFPAGFDPHAASNTGVEIIMTLARWDLGGSIDFGNNPGGGARVTVTFPLSAGNGDDLPKGRSWD